jgi:hypothetical protein
MLQVGRTFGMRDGMLRLEYELQRGSGLMLWRMRSVQGWDSWDLKRIAPGVPAKRPANCSTRWHAPIFLHKRADLEIKYQRNCWLRR